MTLSDSRTSNSYWVTTWALGSPCLYWHSLLEQCFALRSTSISRGVQLNGTHLLSCSDMCLSSLEPEWIRFVLFQQKKKKKNLQSVTQNISISNSYFSMWYGREKHFQLLSFYSGKESRNTSHHYLMHTVTDCDTTFDFYEYYAFSAVNTMLINKPRIGDSPIAYRHVFGST
jgi:hypothetical protein